MGYNTTVLILNDAAHNLESDKDFAARLLDAIRTRSVTKDPVSLSIGNHYGACVVVETHHADETVLVAVGGNTAKTLFSTHSGRGSLAEEVMFRAWAERLGYTVYKKRSHAGL